MSSGPVWPVSARSRVVLVCVILVIGASWLTMLKWRGSSKQSYELDDSPVVLEGLLSATDGASGRLATWFPPLRESVDSGGFRKVSAHNARSLRKLLGCMQGGSCGRNEVRLSLYKDHAQCDLTNTQGKGLLSVYPQSMEKRMILTLVVIILEDGYLVDVVRGAGWLGGEMIW